MKENEIEGASSIFWGRGQVLTGLLWANLKERPMVRPRRRRKDSIKMKIQDVEFGGMDWIEVVQNRDR